LQRIDATGDYARFCLIVRNGLACDCGLPAVMFRPDDAIRYLERLCVDRYYLHEIIFALEAEMPRHIADLRQLKIFERWKSIALRELLKDAASELGVTGANPSAASHSPP
jgi:hypothetical protein